MAKKKRKFHVASFCMLEANLIESEAFLRLSGKAAMLVLIRFYQKAHRKRIKGKSKGIGNMTITNNGQIVFTYAEAAELGISRPTFFRVLRELIQDKGFIDITETGSWYLKQATKFAISQRWKRYGTDLYDRVEVGRLLPPGLGFKKGNKTNIGFMDDTQ
jgi:hypothetical protein